jgi:hypothetical protein
MTVTEPLATGGILGGGMYQFVEPQRECRFYPRKWDPERTAAILARAASWYGAELSGEVLATLRAMSDRARD